MKYEKMVKKCERVHICEEEQDSQTYHDNTYGHMYQFLSDVTTGSPHTEI